MITLPKEKLPPSRKNPKVLYLYGQPKIGKTTILSQLDNCLIIETDEGGADFISALKVQINNMSDFNEVTSMILKENKPYKYIALDTATKFEEYCEVQAGNDYRGSVIGKSFKEGRNILELPDGAGYLWLRLAFQRAMQRLISCAEYIILTGHIRDKFLGEKGKKDDSVASRDLDHTGKIKNMICGAADAIGFLYRTNSIDTGEKLYVSFKTNELVNCGTRCEHLMGSFPFDWNKIYI
jgi:hypothetical protein